MNSPKNKPVHIVGGGLAGLSAAWALVQQGREVHLWESRNHLGGRVCGVTDPETGLELDNGVHVHLGACTETARLFKAWGLDLRWQNPMTVGYRQDADTIGFLREGHLPAPFHLSASFVSFSLLTFMEKLEVARVMARATLMTESHRRGLDKISFEEWLGPTRENVRRVFWDPMMMGTLNGTLDRCSAALALFVLRQGFIFQKEGARIGQLAVTQGVGVSEPLQKVFSDAGVHLHLGKRCQGLVLDSGEVTGINVDDQTHSGHVVLAVPHFLLSALLPEDMKQDDFFKPLDGWGSWPIINVGFLAEQDLPGDPFFCAPYHESQWIFRRPEPTGGTWFIASLSAAFDNLEQGKEALLNRIEQDFKALMPDFAGATIRRKILLPQMKATFAGEPGSQTRRLPQKTPYPGLTLAGAWTDTEWPDTQESAIRSGLKAAAVCL